jgi:hypothetical protein
VADGCDLRNDPPRRGQYAQPRVPERLGFTFVERRTPTVEKNTEARIGMDVVWRLERPRA